MKPFLTNLLLFLIANISANLFAQDTIRLKPPQIEALFLKNNLELISERLNIDIAKAEIAQAKIWENPELSFSDINLWSSESQRDGEDIPPIFGGFGKNRQFSVELSQMISTANKKGKEAGIAKIAKAMTEEDVEDLLRNLKLELRTTIYETIFLQALKETLETQQASMTQLITAFQKQYDAGNLAKTELIRLQSAKYELDGKINETKVDLNENHKTLKSLIATPPMTEIYVEDETFQAVCPADLNLIKMMEIMVQNRPDLRKDQLQIEMAEKTIRLEKSNRIPDLNLSVGYDRRGGVWKDYVGFGLSFDLPLWDRNQQGIKIAKYEKDQNVYEARQNLLEAQNEAIEAFKNYEMAYEFLGNLSRDNLLSELESLYSAYEKNLLKKNVSMLEFIDFIETYLSNKELYLQAIKDERVAFESLQSIIGTEIK